MFIVTGIRSQTLVPDQSGHQRQTSQAGQLYVRDSELRFGDGVDGHTGRSSRWVESFSPGAGISKARVKLLLNRWTANTIVLAADSLAPSIGKWPRSRCRVRMGSP